MPREPRADHIIKNGECQGGSRAEDSFFCQAEHDLHALRATVKLRRKELFAIQQVEDGVDDAQSAAELASASRQRGALLPNFFEADRNVCRVGGFIELDANIFFVDRLEITCPRQTQETGFECALIDGVAFAQENSAAHVVVAELVQSKKFNALHEVRRRVAQIECNARSVILRVERAPSTIAATGLFLAGKKRCLRPAQEELQVVARVPSRPAGECPSLRWIRNGKKGLLPPGWRRIVPRAPTHVAREATGAIVRPIGRLARCQLALPESHGSGNTSGYVGGLLQTLRECMHFCRAMMRAVSMARCCASARAIFLWRLGDGHRSSPGAFEAGGHR